MKRFGIAAALALAAFGVARAAPPLEAYGKLPGLAFVTLSPSGERYAFVADDHGERKLFVSSIANKLLAEVAVGDVKVREVGWAGDDHVLIGISKTYNLGLDFGFQHEVTQVSVLDVPRQKSFWVTNQGAEGSGVWGAYSTAEEGGRWYGYFPSITVVHDRGETHLNKGTPDLYRVDLDTGSAAKVADSPLSDAENIGRTWLVGPRGGVVAHSDYDPRTREWQFYRGDRPDQIVALRDPLGEDDMAGQGRTPGSLLYWRGDGKGGHTLIEVQPPGGGADQVLYNDRLVARLLHDRTTGLLIGATFSGGEAKTEMVSPALQAKVRATARAFPGERMQLASWDAAFDRIIVHTDGDADSGAYWIVDLKIGAANEIGEAYPLVKSADVGAIRFIDYKASDGLAMQGVLTLPPHREARNLPVIVLPHGGPQAHDELGFDWWAQALASRGYAVFQPNFRGSDGYGGAFIEAGKGEWGRKMQTDISDGLKAIADQGIVDPKRACIVGASYGGYAALAGVTVQQGLYRCAVSVGGVADLNAMLRYEEDQHGLVSSSIRYWRAFMGGGGDPARLNALSPAKLAAHADAPVLLIYGRDDTVVQPAQSEEMQRALAGAGKPVETVVLPGEDHWLSRSETRMAMLKATEAFVEKYDPSN